MNSSSRTSYLRQRSGFSFLSDSDDDSDFDLDYATILDNLISRYTNNNLMILGPRNTPYYPLKKIRNNTSNLMNSEFALLTKMASGCGAPRKRKCQDNNVARMILAREKGMPLSDGFSYGDKCRMKNKYLPNEMELLEQHNAKVFCGIFSKDGDYLMTAAQDRQIKVYDTKSSVYKEVNKICAQDVEWSIIDVAISPDSEHLVYSTWSASLQLCSLYAHSDKQEMLPLQDIGRRFCAFSVMFSPNGKEIIAGANDGCMYIYDLEANKRTNRTFAHEVDVNTIAFATESSQIVYSGSDDGLIKVWDRRTFEGITKPVGVLAGHMDGVTHIDSRGDGRHLISNSKDQSIKLWDIRAFSSHNAAEATVKTTQEQPWDYRWQSVPRMLYKAKQMEGDTSLMTYKGHVVIKTLIRCKFSPVATTGQRYIYTGCGIGRVVVYDALTGKMKRQLAGHNATVRDVAWHPYRDEIISSSWDGLVGRWKYTNLSCESDYIDDLLTDDPLNTLPQNVRRSKRLAQKRKQEQ